MPDGATGRYSIWCGGEYLGQDAQGRPWLLTAAHCVKATAFAPANFRVGLGGQPILTYTEASTVGIAQAVPHPQYDAAALHNDIALIQLAAAPGGKAVTLAGAGNDVAPGEQVTISGYGAVASPMGQGIFLPILMEATTVVLSQEECQSILGPATSATITAAQVCIRDPADRRGSCNGDSGGPLFRADGTIAGVTSYGVGDQTTSCRTDFPQVYTRVSAFRDWIGSVAGL
jgi:secreted trypsin-like serine protease